MEEYHRTNTIKAAREEIEKIRVGSYIEKKKKHENLLQTKLNQKEFQKELDVVERKQTYLSFWQE
jgi:hypothetical protein